jgi:parallel beta-helix repeat protein
MKPWISKFAALCGATVLATAAGMISLAGTASAAPVRHHVLRVGCGNHAHPSAYPTIGAAVGAAASGDTILVCPGTYRELITVPTAKQLTIEGVGHPVVDAAGLSDPATGQYSGVLVLASNTTIEGLIIENAIGEGILARGSATAPVTHVTIRDNQVTSNDQGNPTGSVITTSPYAECNGVPGVPGDCGEGIHLWTATDSVIAGNFVSHDSGGILLTDESGPTHGNLIAFNTVASNSFDCGVTLAGHNPAAAPGGVPNPATAGIYDNTVAHNVSTGNGLSGEGSGVLLASAIPGGAVYDNTVVGNYMSGNGLAGVTVHSHVPGQDLNGNVVTGNLIATNNVHGDADSPPDDPATTGVLVRSAGPLSITVTGNAIRSDTYGIWTTSTVAVTGAARNAFIAVGTPVYVVT